jgi:nitrate reductase gamma subunit
MADADLSYQVHVLIGMLLFALWPFTRLVHAFSAPVGYLFRPYVVYRRRRTAGAVPVSSQGRRGWDRTGS